MKTLRYSLLGAAILAAAGCSSDPLRRVDALTATPAPLEQSASRARQALADAPLCCERLDQLPYQAIPIDFSADVVVDASAPAYRFETGKSFFRAFELPRDNRSFEVRLFSQAGETVLAPRVMLLDSRFRPTRMLDADDFTYAPAAGLKGDGLDARLHINRLYADHPAEERYLILYTGEAEMAGATTLQHPAKAYAKALGNEPPTIPDPVAQHAPTGVVKMVLIPERGRAAEPGYVPGYSIGREMGNELPSTPAPAVLPETSAYYRQAIDAALADKDLERALRLADEAGRVGDTSAKAYLLERIQIK